MRPIKMMEEGKVWAVVGVTQDTSKYGYLIYKKLKDKGYKVYGINPNYCEIEGDKIYTSLEELPIKPDIVNFVVNPKIGIEYVKVCDQLGIKAIWLQPGTISSQILSFAEEKQIEVVEACVLVVANYV